MAEKLMYGASEIPSVGKVEFSWVSGPSAPMARPGSGPALTKKDDEDAVMENNESDLMSIRKDVGHEVDYDVAEMDDAWAIE